MLGANWLGLMEDLCSEEFPSEEDVIIEGFNAKIGIIVQIVNCEHYTILILRFATLIK